LVAALALAGCGGRTAQPIASVLTQDQQLNCEQIQSEIAGNEGRIASLAHEERRAHNANIAIGVVGAVLFWPALFALDTTNTEQVEMNALRQRNSMLLMMSGQRSCGVGGARSGSEEAVENRLDRLERLRDNGAINEREYRWRRQEIIQDI
jgi:hypothetical protein